MLATRASEAGEPITIAANIAFSYFSIIPCMSLHMVKYGVRSPKFI